MNEAHLKLCASPDWAAFVESELLPWALARADLGDDVLEIGPGPGLTTDVLRATVPRLVAVEKDGTLAGRLARRLRGTNVEVVRADGSQLPFAPGRFSAATLFTMLHHVESAALQDQLLAELRRVLRPGGIVVGTDSIETQERRDLHLGDAYVPVDPAYMEARLYAAGLVSVVVEQNEDRFRFVGEAPRPNAG